jgi:hypothetical protein
MINQSDFKMPPQISDIALFDFSEIYQNNHDYILNILNREGLYNDINIENISQDTKEALIYYGLGQFVTKKYDINKNIVMGWYIYNCISGGDFTF